MLRSASRRLYPLLRAEQPPRPQYRTNPMKRHFQQLQRDLKTMFKYTGYTALAMAVTGTIAFQSYHLYIEKYCEPTPPELDSRARRMLHGAYFRETVAPDHEVAAHYVRYALDIALLEQKLPEDSELMLNLRLRLAEDERRAGNVLDALSEYARAWKYMPKDSPVAIDTAKKMGDLYMRIGEFREAEEFLVWALHSINEKRSDDDQQQNQLLVTTMCSLASVYALQGEFKLALPLLLQALKQVPQSDISPGNQWLCLKAIIQNQLSECMYGVGKIDEAMGWAQASLESSSKGLESDAKLADCQECGAVVSNNLGKLLEVFKRERRREKEDLADFGFSMQLKGDFDNAVKYYRQAVTYAEAFGNVTIAEHYRDNIQRLSETGESATQAKDVIASVQQEQQENKPSLSSWLNSLWK